MVAAHKGSRRLTSEELGCLPGAPLMGTLDYACSLGEIRECLKEAAGVEADVARVARVVGRMDIRPSPSSSTSRASLTQPIQLTEGGSWDGS